MIPAVNALATVLEQRGSHAVSHTVTLIDLRDPRFEPPVEHLKTLGVTIPIDALQQLRNHGIVWIKQSPLHAHDQTNDHIHAARNEASHHHTLYDRNDGSHKDSKLNSATAE